MKAAFLGEGAARDAQLVGAKAATLSRLAERFRVPPGFCLAASVFDELGRATEGHQPSLDALRALVRAGHRDLATRTGRSDPAVAVRSSAIGEDGAESSFAGQHETVLDVRGVDAIVDAVLRCWRSATSERAVAYQKERGITERSRVGVLVQELVGADVAVIAFSAHPVTRDRDVVFVNASWGLGESLASGSVTPDEYEIRKSDGLITRRQVADKAIETVRTASGVVDRPVPAARRHTPALGDDQLREVARLAIALEAESGCPVDIECAFAGGVLHLLQSRPITTLGETEFPVRWEREGDEELTWRQEDAHMAEARPMLSNEYSINGPQFGINKRFERLDAPVRVRYQVVNCYMYVTTRTLVPPDKMAEANGRLVAMRRRSARGFRRTWDEEFLPAVHAHYDGIDAIDPAELTPHAAVEAWDDLWRRHREVWVTHMNTTGPSYAVVDELAELYAELTGRPATDAPALVQGRAGTLQELERTLHAIIVAIRARPRLATAVVDSEIRTPEALARDADGAALAPAVQAFLDRFGDAGQLSLELRGPSWSDDPRLLFADIARRLGAMGDDPDARLARLRARADELADEVRALLRERPDDLARFEEVLACARAVGPLTEEHNFWIDRKIQAHVRRAVLRFGARLVGDDVVDAPDDIYHLSVTEIASALAEPRDLRPLVRERVRELRWAERLRAPRVLGKPPSAPDAPNARIIDLGYRMTQTGGDVLVGVPASAGIARGPARLIRDPSRFDRFTKGDVLVCTSSNVSWIPLFTIASAIVADIGGALSHAAVVAREFGVPAVVGTGTALEILTDGEMVEVDGTAGTVRRLAPR